MKVENTKFLDLKIIKPSVYHDERGYFMESFDQKEYELICGTKFVQDNESKSFKNVLRGLHFQNPPYGQAKLVRVVNGSILDIVVDLRKKSPTFGQYFSYILSDDNKAQLFIPVGFAHGFLSLEDNTIINYKCSEFYHKESEGSLLWNDKELKIEWNIENPILTDKDSNADIFSTFESPF